MCVSLTIVLAALIFLMVVAYRGYSVILFAPVAALGAVLLTAPDLVAPVFTGLYMDKLVGFLKLYFPVFVLGAVFGKMIELSGFSRSIASSVIRLIGGQRTILAIVAVCALLTYGGVSLFVVVFAVYPFAADLFRRGNIPKRLIPGTIALGAFSFTMDCLPGSPQIQNIIPIAFFKTNLYAAPWLGSIGAVFILTAGLLYLNWRRRRADAAGEGYGTNHLNEPQPHPDERLVNPLVAVLPLVLVGITNKALAVTIPLLYGDSHSFQPAAPGDHAGRARCLQDRSHLGRPGSTARRQPDRSRAGLEADGTAGLPKAPSRLSPGPFWRRQTRPRNTALGRSSHRCPDSR